MSNDGARALVVDPTSLTHLSLGSVPEPAPAPHEVVIDVRHVSLNYGDTVRAQLEPPGTPLGFDAAGIVRCPAADGTGPVTGARVVAFGKGTWVERIAIDADCVATVPSSVDLVGAAALPAAGLAALRALRASGALLGKRVLVTGASGGVGRYAVQLAAIGGAHVIAAVGSTTKAAGMEALGAHEIVVGLEGISAYPARVDVVIENIGGAHLAAALERLGPGGTLQSVGWASKEPAVFAAYSTMAFGRTRHVSDASGLLFCGGDIGQDLSVLLGYLAAGKLSAEVAWRGSWRKAADAMAQMHARRLAGKAVLDVD